MPFHAPQDAVQRFLKRALLFAGLLGAAVASQVSAQPATDSSTYSVPVYVSYFELYSVGPPPRPDSGVAATPDKSKTASPVLYNDSDLPSERARRMQEYFSMALVKALSSKGFTASRAPGQNPQAGVMIRGVFAEPDTRNRIRRALLGSAAPSAKFLLYVGIFNLTKQEQPLYLLPTAEQPQSNRYGPVITMNTYVPMAKYEVDKNPSEEDVQKICNQIAASLAALVAANPNAFSQ